MRKKHFAYLFMLNFIYIFQKWGYETLLNFGNMHITILLPERILKNTQFEDIYNLNAQFLTRENKYLLE